MAWNGRAIWSLFVAPRENGATEAVHNVSEEKKYFSSVLGLE